MSVRPVIERQFGLTGPFNLMERVNQHIDSLDELERTGQADPHLFSAVESAFMYLALPKEGIDAPPLRDGRRSTLQQLKARITSYRCRIGDKGKTDDQNLSTLLFSKARMWHWKLPLKTYKSVEGEWVPIDELNAVQERRLVAALAYPIFCELMLEAEEICIDFFKWSLIDNCPVEPFIEFYGTCQKILKKAFLHKRIGFFSRTVDQEDSRPYSSCHSNQPLKIKQRRDGSKKLTLPFETEDRRCRDRSIMNTDKQVTFFGGYTVTIGEIFAQFRRKKVEPGNFEMLQGVIRNWNYFYGSWNGIEQQFVDFNPNWDGWFSSLPLFHQMKRSEVSEHYNVEIPHDTTPFIIAMRANREVASMDIAGTHGFVEFLLPLTEEWYGVFPFTFIATQFTTGWERYPANCILSKTYCFIDNLFKIFRLGKTERGLWAYPDETPFYTQRQQAVFATTVTKEKFFEHLEVLRNDILRSRAGNEHFQISYKNCAGTVEMQAHRVHAKTVIPELFAADILESTPREPLGKFFRWVRTLPEWQVVVLIWLFGVLLAAWNGILVERNGRRRYTCMMQTPIFSTRQIFHAGKIFEKILNQSIRGAIWYGHTTHA